MMPRTASSARAKERASLTGLAAGLNFADASMAMILPNDGRLYHAEQHTAAATGLSTLIFRHIRSSPVKMRLYGLGSLDDN
jgi:hypothetical protein